MSQNRIAITGTIASGKSVLSAYLLGWDYAVIDADDIARELVEPESDVLNAIKEAFSDDVIKPDATLDREKLASIIFKDENKREVLNRIMHPAIAKAISAMIRDKKGVIFFEIPLLFENRETLAENGLTFDEIWLVDADEKVRIKRLMERDQIDEAYAKEKINSQMPSKEKRRLADKVFDNSKDLLHLYKQVDQAMEALRGETN